MASAVSRCGGGARGASSFVNMVYLVLRAL
jgi:hypothetical protein